MKTKIIIFPTLRYAFYEWHRLIDTYPDSWVEVCRKPMSLTTKDGTNYVFHSESEVYCLKGCHAEFISPDEIVV